MISKEQKENNMKKIIFLLFISISFSFCEENLLDTIKKSAILGWEKTKETTSNLVDKVKDSEFVENSSEKIKDSWEIAKEKSIEIKEKVEDNQFYQDTKEKAKDKYEDIKNSEIVEESKEKVQNSEFLEVTKEKASNLWDKTKSFVSQKYEDLKN
jgi:glutamyl/glutaminyl-tRNA synthetase